MFPLPHHQIPGGQARVEGSFHDGKGTTSFFFFLNLFGYSCSLLQHVGSISPTRDRTRASCIGDAES